MEHACLLGCSLKVELWKAFAVVGGVV